MTDGSDSRPQPPPQPQYGEYATAEEQRARIARHDPAIAPPEEGRSAEPKAASARATGSAGPARSAGVDSSATTGSAGKAGADSARSGKFADRIVTVALLAYGLFTVVSSISAFGDYSAYTQNLLEILGVEATLADPAGARPWGIAAGIVLGIGWLVTAVLAWRWLRRGKLTFWIPLVGGVVFNLLAAALMVVPLLSDPALVDAILEVTQ